MKRLKKAVQTFPTPFVEREALWTAPAQVGRIENPS